MRSSGRRGNVGVAWKTCALVRAVGGIFAGVLVLDLNEGGNLLFVPRC